MRRAASAAAGKRAATALSHFITPHPVPFHFATSHPIPSYTVPPNITTSHPVPSHPIPSCFTTSRPVPAQYRHIPSHPVPPRRSPPAHIRCSPRTSADLPNPGQVRISRTPDECGFPEPRSGRSWGRRLNLFVSPTMSGVSALLIFCALGNTMDAARIFGALGLLVTLKARRRRRPRRPSPALHSQRSASHC